MYASVCACMFQSVCVCVCACSCIHVCVYLCVGVHDCICVCVCISICVCVCVYVCCGGVGCMIGHGGCGLYRGMRWLNAHPCFPHICDDSTTPRARWHPYQHPHPPLHNITHRSVLFPQNKQNVWAGGVVLIWLLLVTSTYHQEVFFHASGKDRISTELPPQCTARCSFVPVKKDTVVSFLFYLYMLNHCDH
jgi:hypothetical protein